MMRRVRIPLLLLVYSFCLLLCGGSDGWLRMDYLHIDSSWFYMAGKAWMEGLTPYTDFADTKGPLLWLIYGAGYLMSKNSLTGVYWMGVGAYWVTFLFLYRTAMLLLRSDAKSLLAVTLTSLCLFIPGVHNEIRAEDFSLPFFAVTFLVMARSILKRKYMVSEGLLLGMAIGGTALIKYNISFILTVPVFFLIAYCLKTSGPRACAIFVSVIFAGILALWLPFAVYFLAAGNIGDFAREYFINAYLTVREMRGVPGEYPDAAASGLKHLIKSRMWLGIVFKALLILSAFLPTKVYKSNMLRVAIWGSLAAAAFFSSLVIHEYYLACLGIFAFWGMVSVCSFIRRMGVSASIFSGAAAILIVIIAGNSRCMDRQGEFHDTRLALHQQAVMKDISSVMMEYSRGIKRMPTIAYVNLMDCGEASCACALPAIKYWAMQNGATPRMRDGNHNDVLTARPDFVVARHSDIPYHEQLEKAGYRRVMDYSLLSLDSEVPERCLFVKHSE